MLHARLAEIRALRELPDSTKNLLFPVIKIRPWLNAKSLDKAFEAVEQAIGNRLYAVDLDSTKYTPPSDNQTPAQAAFSDLFNSASGYKTYYEKVSEGPNRIPVFQGITDLATDVDLQLSHVREMDRGLVIRSTPTSPGKMLEIAQKVSDLRIDNCVFVIDCGWGRDILSSASLCASLVQSIIDLRGDLEVVVGGSSFPIDFSDRGTRFQTTLIERPLFQEVRRLVNGGDLVYGDWGSTRPPTDPVPMRNVPRIDIATPVNWISWRSENGEDYSDIANRTVQDSDWDGSLGIWGEYMIVSTANGAGDCIRSPAMAAAVRVNIHLHQQANFDNPTGLHVGDEPVGDDL
jgi:hypothetical protein